MKLNHSWLPAKIFLATSGNFHPRWKKILRTHMVSIMIAAMIRGLPTTIH